MINIAIIEDNDADAKILSDYIERFFGGDTREYSVARYSGGIAFLDKYTKRYDIIFMDIDMPAMNGMEVSRRVREIDSDVIIIFVTNMAQYAINGYEVNAFDFVVKPITYNNFAIKLDRAVSRYAKTFSESILVKSVYGATHNLKASDIKYIEVMDNTVVYHLGRGVTVTASGQLAHLEPKLLSCGFFKCNRCYLVNLKHVQTITDDGVVIDGETLAVSRRRKKEFKRALADYLGGGV